MKGDVMMGSRMMHAIIANRIADQLSIKDKPSFLLGGIAPDAVSPKEASHFYSGDVNDYTRRIDYEQFIHKYNKHIHSDYMLGYYTHLIADDLWLKGFYLPWLKNRMEKDESIFTQYHQDFRLLNGKLLNYYSIAEEIKANLQNDGVVIELEEVSRNAVIHFIPHIIEDIHYNSSVIHEPLNVFTLDQIVGYIETSVDMGLMHLKRV
ncbi:zinc dependent phospholipase C family protein [Bacillus sp. 31A1R]|uniref:Zinc dependent phospholipase C family protein n=1 Tax=Robertmurraya mangrovi TaxID=3098077 RepID=A0ABU5J0Y0_9BACI|nr:zinc dependent phospholipase C family protein [Bacillus sp. 31A1R]MDZ5473075.1 zinc dependent phospholipase C family protein [Bacillus sp. 31A1R]